MRVLWLNHRDIKHPRAGGSERTIYEIGKRFVDMGLEIYLISVNSGGLQKHEIIDGINVNRIRNNVIAHLVAPLMIWKIRPDIVVDDLAHVVPWFSSFFTRKKVVVFFHHLHSRTLPGQVGKPLSVILSSLERSYRFVYGKEMFVTESETSFNDLVSLDIDSRRIRRILPGVRHDLFHPSIKSERPTLIYYGGMRDYKRPWYSIEVLKSLKQDGTVLKIVGNGPSLEKVKERTKTYNLNDRVSFLGRLSDEELAKEVSEAWINLHFAQAEGFGLTIVESAACGTPTVALDVPGVSEIIKNYNLGFVETSIDRLIEDIKKIIEDYGNYSSLTVKNSLTFSWDEAAKKWKELFEEVVR